MQHLLPDGFRHEQQSLRVVEKLENDGNGLNLTFEVRDGIARHSKGAGPLLEVPQAILPATLEGQIVRLADVIAYVNHDLDDALRARVLRTSELPSSVERVLGTSHSARLTRLVCDILDHTNLEKQPMIKMSSAAAGAIEELRLFLYQRVYYNDLVHREFHKARALLEQLWCHFSEDLGRFYTVYWPSAVRDSKPEDDIRDFMAGMTDAFAVSLHEEIFTPRRWYVM